MPVTDLGVGDRPLARDVAHYVVRVRRLAVGDRFLAFDAARALEADAEILAVAPDGVQVRVGALRPSPAVARRDVAWVQALPKGEKMDAIVRDATELGATRIVPATTAFTVVRLDGPRGERRRQRWERIATEAARQCGRGDVPEIHAIVPWEVALAACQASFGQTGGTGFCLHERATLPLGPILLGALGTSSPLVFAAGPEGGLSPAEVAHASTRGFAVVSLGPFVLRAETVVAATLGAVRALEGM